jgi:hypothetical protein
MTMTLPEGRWARSTCRGASSSRRSTSACSTRILVAPPLDASAFGVPAMEDGLALARRGRDRCGDSDPPVAFAIAGGTKVGSPTPRRLLAFAAEQGMSVHITNGAW